jgi:hypothetical protein
MVVFTGDAVPKVEARGRGAGFFNVIRKGL